MGSAAREAEHAVGHRLVLGGCSETSQGKHRSRELGGRAAETDIGRFRVERGRFTLNIITERMNTEVVFVGLTIFIDILCLLPTGEKENIN